MKVVTAFAFVFEGLIVDVVAGVGVCCSCGSRSGGDHPKVGIIGGGFHPKVGIIGRRFLEETVHRQKTKETPTANTIGASSTQTNK